MRMSRQDWVDAGLGLLREEGQQALTIERLTKQLGVTKGSFYHHFGNLAGFRQALLECWEERFTLHPMEVARVEPDPVLRARLLGETVARLDHRLDLAFRAWGMREREVREYVRRVDARRQECLAELHQAMGRSQPHLLASIEYAAFIGWQQLGLPLGHDMYRGLGRALELLSGELKGDL